MISTDRNMFVKDSPVVMRQIDLARDWDEIHIIVFSDRRHGELNIAPNVWVYSTRSRFRGLYPVDAIRLGRFVAEKRRITHITCQDASFTAMAGMSLKKQFHVPLEIQIHEDIGSTNYGYNIMHRLRKALAFSYIPRADTIRVVSDSLRRYLVDSLRIPISRITVRPIAVDVNAIAAAPILSTADLKRKYPQFSQIVLVASRLEPEKNIGLAIEAWSEVIRHMPQAGLLIVGRGSQRRVLEAEVRRRTLGPNVVFEDWAGRDVLISYYKTADAVLVTSLYEGYGMSIVEARAAGCVVVATDVGVAREQGAYIVDWSQAAVAQGIVEVLRSRRIDHL